VSEDGQTRRAILAGSRPDARGRVASCFHAARPGRIQDGADDARILRAQLARALPRGSGACGWPEACHGDHAGTPRPCGRWTAARRRRVLRLTSWTPDALRPAGHPDRLTSRRSRLGCFLFSCGPPARIQDGAGDARFLRAHVVAVRAPARRGSVGRRLRLGGPGSPLRTPFPVRRRAEGTRNRESAQKEKPAGTGSRPAPCSAHVARFDLTGRTASPRSPPPDA
jgi:hypothetical protein